MKSKKILLCFIPILTTVIVCLFYFLIGNPIYREVSKYVAVSSLSLFKEDSILSVEKIKYMYKNKEYIVFLKDEENKNISVGVSGKDFTAHIYEIEK